MNLTKNYVLFEILQKGEKLEKKLLKNHLLAIIVLICMVSITYIILTNIIKTQSDGSSLINISGKQRMYTQKVLFFVNKSDITQNHQPIFYNMMQLDKNNNFLLKKLKDSTSIGFNNLNILHLFENKKGIKDKYIKLNSSIKRYINAKDITQKTNELIIIESLATQLISLYDEITLIYQDLSEKKVNELLQYQKIVLIISLITIILEGLLIFKPAIYEVFRTHSKLRDLNKNLNKEVQTQVDTLRKQEQIMIQQSKLAEMGEMLSDISHQWKQPLTILAMHLEDIQLDINDILKSNKEINQSFEKSLSLVKYMSTTVEDFKNFYKPDTNKADFNIINSINEILKMEKPLLYKYHIKTSISCKDKDTICNGYESQLMQVLLSLTNNAIDQIIEMKETNKEKIFKIDFEILRIDDKLAISVIDNAGGIKNEIIDKIFTPYFTTKDNIGGSGIGLYMAKTIIEKNFEGSLGVENIQGGAKFKILI